MGKYSKHLDPGEHVDVAPPKKRTTTVLSLRLASQEFDRLADEADRQGMAVGALARRYVREGLQREGHDAVSWTRSFPSSARGTVVIGYRQFGPRARFSSPPLPYFELR